MANQKYLGPDGSIRRVSRLAMRWAHPRWEAPAGLDDASARTQCEELSKTVWNLTSLLVGACLFCFVILGAPDANLVSADAKISIPIASLVVSYGDFLVFGPVFLIGLSLYLHVFLEQLIRVRLYKSPNAGPDQSQPAPAPSPSPFVFNLRRPSADLLSAFLFYALLPCTLAFFVVKAIPRPDTPWILMLVFVVTTGFMAALAIRRSAAGRSTSPSLTARTALWVLFGACVVFFLPLAWIAGQICYETLATQPSQLADAPEIPRSRRPDSALLRIRRLQLFAAALNKKNLNGFYAPYADLRKADLQEADLEGADLSHADLRKANLANANLTGADLSGARLESAHLASARLNGADLRNAALDDLTEIDPKWRTTACIVNGDLSRACTGRVELAWADLSNANLRNAHFAGAQLTGVDLSHADLTGADLTGAILRLADLRNTRLPPSVKDAVVDGALTTGPTALRHADSEATILLLNRASGACLEQPADPENFSHPHMSYPCPQGPDPGFDWKVRRLSNAAFVLRSPRLNKAKVPACLDGTSVSADWVPMQMWECNDDYENQHWKIEPVFDQYVMVVKEKTKFCLHGAGTRDGSPVPVLAACNHDDHSQHWRIVLPGGNAPVPNMLSGPAIHQRRLQDLNRTARDFAISPWGPYAYYGRPGGSGRPYYGFGSSFYYGARSSFYAPGFRRPQP